MGRNTKGFLLVACSLVVSMVHADTLALSEALTQGTWEGRLRTQYFMTDWEDNTPSGRDGKDASGFAIGGSILYKTASFYGLRLGGGLYTTQNGFGLTDVEDGSTATTSLDLFRRAGSEKFYSKGYSVLAQAYLGYDFSKTKIKIGRFLMTNPWITPNDTKMIPIVAQGVQVVSNEIQNTTFQLDYIDKFKERGAVYFGNMADGLDVPNGIRKHYSTHYNKGDESNNESAGVFVAGMRNTSINNLDIALWGMHWKDLVSQARVEANYLLKLGGTSIGLGGLFVQQFDDGAGDLIQPKLNNKDKDNSVKTNLIAAKAMVYYGDAGFLVSASKTSSDGDILSPWRGFPTQGYTRSMTQTDWNAGTKAYKLGLYYDWNGFSSGLKSELSYSHYNRDETKKPYSKATNRGFSNGDTDQWNLDIIKQLSGAYKGIELRARFMHQENEATQLYPLESSNREMRLEANYRF